MPPTTDHDHDRIEYLEQQNTQLLQEASYDLAQIDYLERELATIRTEIIAIKAATGSRNTMFVPQILILIIAAMYACYANTTSI
jgi:hypothetical protein